MLGKMVEALTQAPSVVQAGQTTTTAPATVTVPLQPDHLRSAIYRQFGAYLDVSGIVEDRTGTLDRLAKEVGASLVQQRERVLDLADDVLAATLDEHCPPTVHAEDWDLDALEAALQERFGFAPDLKKKTLEREALAGELWSEIEKIVDARESEFTLPFFLYLSRHFFLEEIDARWIDHLKSMEALREGIGLRGYGQKDPKQEYKKEGFVVFGEMMTAIQKNVCEKLFHVQIQREQEAAPEIPAAQRRQTRKTIESSGGGSPAQTAGGAQAAAQAQAGGNGEGDGEPQQPQRRAEPKVGRNDPCPCGSGKKYKKCHGSASASA
jgi:preprotein translocase subunit SecA